MGSWRMPLPGTAEDQRVEKLDQLGTGLCFGGSCANSMQLWDVLSMRRRKRDMSSRERV